MNNWAEELGMVLLPLKPQLLRDLCLDLSLLLYLDFFKHKLSSSPWTFVVRNSGGMSSQPLLSGLFLELARMIFCFLSKLRIVPAAGTGAGLVSSWEFCTLFSPVLLWGKWSLNHAETLIYSSLSMSLTSTFLFLVGW